MRSDGEVCGEGLNVTADSRDDWLVDLVDELGPQPGEVKRLAGPFGVGGCAVGYGCQVPVAEDVNPSTLKSKKSFDTAIDSEAHEKIP